MYFFGKELDRQQDINDIRLPKADEAQEEFRWREVDERLRVGITCAEMSFRR